MTDTIAASAERAALRVSIEARDAAETRLRDARDAVARAGQLVASLQTDVDRYSEAEARATAHRAARIKETVLAGADAPRPDLRLTDDLARTLAAKAAAEADMAAARDAHAALIEEAATAEQAHTAAELAVHRAVLAVLRVESAELGKQLAALEEQAFTLRQRLVSYSWCRMRLPDRDGTELFPLTQDTIDLLRRPPKTVDLKRPPPFIEQWAAFYRALGKDAHATRSD